MKARNVVTPEVRREIREIVREVQQLMAVAGFPTFPCPLSPCKHWWQSLIPSVY